MVYCQGEKVFQFNSTWTKDIQRACLYIHRIIASAYIFINMLVNFPQLNFSLFLCYV